MNERIFTELYKKAWGHFPCPTGEPELEKFAELLIRECMELTRWKEFDMSVEQRIRLSVYQDIKEHFGVE